MLLSNYFNSPRSTLRKIVEHMKIGESLLSREIVERTGMVGSLVYLTMYRLEVRGMVQRVPFVWPTPPEGSDLWGQRRLRVWRKGIVGSNRGRMGVRWRFLGFTVTPVDELLKLARIDLNARRLSS